MIVSLPALMCPTRFLALWNLFISRMAVSISLKTNNEMIFVIRKDLAGNLIELGIKPAIMPDQKTIRRARRDRRQGKSASTQAGEFVREEIENIRQGKHGARSAKQAIAIGLSKARRSGVKLKPPKKGTVSEKTRRSAKQAYEKGQRHVPVSAARSRASEKALKLESTSAASHGALSRQAREAAKKRSAKERSAAAKKAAKTKGPRKRSQAAKKAATTRARRNG
jgi:hypothetical protein